LARLRHAEPERRTFRKQFLPKAPPLRTVSSGHDRNLVEDMEFKYTSHAIMAGKDVDLLTVTLIFKMTKRAAEYVSVPRSTRSQRALRAADFDRSGTASKTAVFLESVKTVVLWDSEQTHALR
jgi:hypothetical protein